MIKVGVYLVGVGWVNTMFQDENTKTLYVGGGWIRGGMEIIVFIVHKMGGKRGIVLMLMEKMTRVYLMGVGVGEWAQCFKMKILRLFMLGGMELGGDERA